MVNSTATTQTQDNWVFESHLLEDLHDCSLAVLYLLADDSTRNFNASHAVRCLLQGCNEMASVLYESVNEQAGLPLDTQSISAKAVSACALAENEWEQNDSWITPVQHLYISLNEELNSALHIFHQEIQREKANTKQFY